MTRNGLMLIFTIFAVPPAVAQGVADRVRTVSGTTTGEVTDMTPLEVALNKGRPGSKAIAINEVRSIVFDGEPPELTQARVNAANGAYANAVSALEDIDVSVIKREFIAQDVEFYRAFCAAKLALGGEGEIGAAGRLLNTFVRRHPNNYHYLAAVELMGDLLVAGGRHEQARRQYTELAKAPWPEYKIRAAVAAGRTLQEQNDHAEAIKQFDAALAIADEGPDAQNQQLAATLGKAVSLAETGGVDQAVGIIERVIRTADPREKELHARAYNALGTCYEKAGKTKDALLAFLHVDVVFNTVPEAHAEALANLVPLWQAVGEEERSREARQLLEERYGKSRWAKELK